MDFTKKTEICRKCAKAIKTKYQTSRLEFDELVNVGFVSIKTEDDEKKASQEAWYHMLHFATRLLGYDYDNRKSNYIQESLNRAEVFEHNTDELDIRYLMKFIRPIDRRLIKMRFVDGMTYKNIREQTEYQSPRWRVEQVLSSLRRKFGV